ncbi:MAG: hypothetical protein J6B10_01170 [Lachnospiraceae bacterium]|nr:hypothetical protein [Lachnospiraceae bacterium]
MIEADTRLAEAGVACVGEPTGSVWVFCARQKQCLVIKYGRKEPTAWAA